MLLYIGVMSKKGKRGRAKCKKKLEEEDYFIEFDENGGEIGEHADDFITWIGEKQRADIPYYQMAKDVKDELWEKLWEETKVLSKLFFISYISFLLFITLIHILCFICI